MADIAQLGITINSSQVTTATAALTGLTNAAKPAGAAVTALNTAAAPATAALASHAKAAAGAATAHAGMSTQAMSAFHSIRSMAEGLALGMPPMMVATQQLNHLSYAASGPGGLSGAFKEALGAFRGLISPTTAIVAATAAVTVGFGVAIIKIAETEKAFGELAERTGITVQALHGLQSVAAREGIGSPEFLKGIMHFNELSVEATHNIGALAEQFRANKIAVGTTNENLARAANLIANMRGDQEKARLLQALGLPATREWVQFLGQGADKIREATANAVQFGGAADERLIKAAREFDKEWNTAWNNFANFGKNAFVTIWDKFKPLYDAWKIGATLLAHPIDALMGKPHLPTRFDDAFSQTDRQQNAALKSALESRAATMRPGTTPTVLAEDVRKTIALEQQRLGILGQTATVEQQVRAVELSIQAARLDGVNITSKEAENLKRLARERALGIDQIHQNTDALRTEINAFGMDAGQAAAFTAVQNKINEARRLGVPLTESQIDAIRREASVLGEATQKLENMRFASDTLGSAMKDFRTQIQQGASTMDALRHSAMTALNAIADKLIDMAAKKLVEGAFSAGGFDFLKALVPAAHSGYGPGDPLLATRAISASDFLGAPRYHSGMIAGERPAILRDDESVLTPGQMKALGGGRSGGNITIAPVINVTGGAPGDDGQARKFAGMIAENVRRIALETIRDQRRPGGVLA